MSLPRHPLLGSYYVTPTATAMHRAWSLCGKMRDYQILRRHALKLAHFPSCGDWDWVKALSKKRVGELRVDEIVAGHSNIRIIFFKTNTTLEGEPFPRIWPLTVFDKKAQFFTKKEVAAFRSMRDIVIHRKYGGNQSA